MSAEHNYWRECVDAAADECGLVLTDAQAECLAGAFEGGHENYGMAFYQPSAWEHYRSEIERLTSELATEREKVICPECKGEGGSMTYGGTFMSFSECYKCHGKKWVKP